MTGGGDCEEEPSHRQVIYPPGGLRQLNIRIFNFFDAPVTWFREKVVKPNQKEYPWYHQKFPRVREIDQCYTDEHDCIYEANQQFKKDRQVDTHIINILRYRVDDCVREEYPDHLPRCIQLKEDYEQASANWFAKYGDLGAMYNVKEAFMKQKHRLLWERRHGPVGSGMKKDPFEVEPDEH